jgi:macrolide-specific efflux system membrane fusion protein
MVMVAAPDGTLETRPVELGVSNRVQVEITAGLADGERVVSGIATATAPRRNPMP